MTCITGEKILFFILTWGVGSTCRIGLGGGVAGITGGVTTSAEGMVEIASLYSLTITGTWVVNLSNNNFSKIIQPKQQWLSVEGPPPAYQ